MVSSSAKPKALTTVVLMFKPTEIIQHIITSDGVVAARLVKNTAEKMTLPFRFYPMSRSSLMHLPLFGEIAGGEFWHTV